MINYISQGGSTQYNVVELVVDTAAEIVDLPTNFAPGSTCLIIENSAIYMLGSDFQWHEI